MMVGGYGIPLPTNLSPPGILGRSEEPGRVTVGVRALELGIKGWQREALRFPAAGYPLRGAKLARAVEGEGRLRDIAVNCHLAQTWAQTWERTSWQQAPTRS